MINHSKQNDPRFWRGWRESGAVDLDRAISMEPIIEKLRHLRDYLPSMDETVYQFGSFLAVRLNPRLVPAGFNLAAELAFYDLNKCVDGYSGKPISSGLAGLPPIVYEILRWSVPGIANAVCPENFSKSVEKVIKKVNAKLSRKK